MRLIDADEIKARIEFVIEDSSELITSSVVRKAMLKLVDMTKTAKTINYELGEYDTLDLLTSAWYGKQYYFREKNGMIYSRDSTEYMTLDDAITEFANRLGDDGSI